MKNKIQRWIGQGHRARPRSFRPYVQQVSNLMGLCVAGGGSLTNRRGEEEEEDKGNERGGASSRRFIH